MGRVGGKARRLAAASAVAAATTLLAAGVAQGASEPTPWDGANPFHCVVQNVSFGTAFPRPGDDPFCVEFDKTRQNVTELGVVDFLSQEPARVAAASDKCWYHQSDHWRGSVVQSDPSTKTYEWDGSYFFDKSTGDGGVHVTNFNFNGQTFDPRALPGFPRQYDNFYGPGTGGLISHNSVKVDPRCVAKAAGGIAAGHKHHGVYNPASPLRGCVALRGTVGSRRLGGLPVGTTERQIRNLLGVPPRSSRGFLRYCLIGGGSFLVGVTGDARAALLLTDRSAFRLQGVGVGTLERKLRRGWTRATLRLRVGKTNVYALNRRSGVLCGVRGGVVRWLAVYDPSRVRTIAGLAGYVLRSSG